MFSGRGSKSGAVWYRGFPPTQGGATGTSEGYIFIDPARVLRKRTTQALTSPEQSIDLKPVVCIAGDTVPSIRCAISRQVNRRLAPPATLGGLGVVTAADSRDDVWIVSGVIVALYRLEASRTWNPRDGFNRVGRERGGQRRRERKGEKENGGKRG